MDYRETFWIPGIDFMPFPVYAISKKGRIVNFKAMVYPSPRSYKRFTRNKQLRFRSGQAKVFDFLISIDYFSGLGPIVKEMPVIIENGKRVEGMDSGLYILLDYYFPSLHLAVELDSDYHSPEKDAKRDEYLLKNHGIKTYRINDLLKSVTKFKGLIKLLKTMKVEKPSPLKMNDELERYLHGKSL